MHTLTHTFKLPLHPPTHTRARAQHELDYLGLPLPCRLPVRLPPSHPYLFVHSYSCAAVDEGGQDIGMLLYSSSGGWSSLDKDTGDPRPPGMDPEVCGVCGGVQCVCVGGGEGRGVASAVRGCTCVRLVPSEGAPCVC
jgi:hypothetical protein